MLFLNVPYAEKDQAKQLGARWDAESKKWYAPVGALLTLFDRWLPSSAAANALLRAKPVAGKEKGARRPRKAPVARLDATAGLITIGVNYVEQVGTVGPPWN